jgi:glyoxylase-like metal-dependent hydrolase (beta-lactamase superfamily II)
VEKLDLFITHLHADHCGLTADLVGSDTTVYASAGDGAGINHMTEGPAFWLELLTDMAKHGCSRELLHSLESNHPAIRFGPSGPILFTPVQEGNVLRYGAFAWHVLSVPGHTPDHLALYDPAHKILFSGDLILGDITPNIPRWREMDDALGTYLLSLDKVDKLEIELTLPGHRSLVHDTKARIKSLRRHHAIRLDEVRRILDGKNLNAYEVAAEMTWSMRGITWDEFPTPQKWFASNEALSHLDHLAALGEVVRIRENGAIRFSLSSKPARN